MVLDPKRLLLRELEAWHQDYNPELRMVRRPFSSPGYHTTLKHTTHTHPTLAAVMYALALLDSGVEAYVPRASDILEQVISLQDQNPANATFGIWSWFQEEPLAQMAPPDWNWADFCGKRLVLTEQRHGSLLPADLREKLRHAVFCACDAIMKRNVGPGYTNIAIMGAFVTLVAGEVYGIDRYVHYGLERLRRFREYTHDLGTFQEYNSPTYTIVAIQELSSIHTSTRLPDAKLWSADMLDVAWRMVAEHYHFPTGQWSGPHSRSYSTVMTESVRSFLQMAVGDTLQLQSESKLVYSLDWYGNSISCPEAYIASFHHAQVAEHSQVVQRSPEGVAINIATTFKNGQVSLGTFSRDVMWNQRRNLIAYVPNGDGFSYIHLRFLHDGYDYSSAVYTSRQERTDVLFGIGFCTDGGDTHIGLDPINGSIEAEDLRLRFEIGGRSEGVEADLLAQHGKKSVQVRLPDGITMQTEVLFAAFDGETPRWEISRDADKSCIDYIVYSGEKKPFDFRSMQRALMVLAFRLYDGSTGKAESLEASARVVQAQDDAETANADKAAEQVYARYRTLSGTELDLGLPLKPATKQEMLQ
ncbi:hypothetical protein [Paenibacillus rigui]|uniref:Heparinase n=1 Tax=Paenibacillus rigui TaxID=554312 RepID=A0A229UIV6_9BACL|nr:hypothetical protein [Paenibacillus rigui]OXM83397.1 hypothetical protein CF651_25625 [Paenibacillus rigui]